MRPTPTWECRSSTDAELAVGLELERQGWHILLRNARGPGFELDLVARKGGTLTFVEVKARRRLPADERTMSGLVSWRKRSAMKRGAAIVMSRMRIEGVRTTRFDLAVVYRGGIKYFVSFME